MEYSISDILLSRLSELFAAKVGLHFPKERWADIERGIVSAAKDFGFSDTESCIRWLLSSSLTKSQIEILASHFTIGETYFFRDRKCFEVLEERIFPELINSCRASERRLRIWSAGCATGEEPYSIAILLNKMIPDLSKWNITILATDINPHFIKKASEGVYNHWSFRDAPSWIKEGYFELTGEGRFKILPHVKNMVTFFYLNLVEDSYPSLLNNTNAIDVIFCRNVLMYFTSENVKKITDKLNRSLVDGGWLTVSPCEISMVYSSQFVTVNINEITFYRKGISKSQTAEELLPKGYSPYVLDRGKAPATLPPYEFDGEPRAEVIPPRVTQGITAEEPETLKLQPITYEKASTLYKQGLYAEAAEMIIELVSQKKENGRAIALLSRVFANQGKLTESLEWCEKAIAMDKLNPGSHYLRAMILQEQGQIEEAVKSLQRTLYLDSNFILAHFALGNLSRIKGKIKESDRHFENVLLLLNAHQEEENLQESDGITVKRLKEIIMSTVQKT